MYLNRRDLYVRSRQLIRPRKKRGEREKINGVVEIRDLVQLFPFFFTVVAKNK